MPPKRNNSGIAIQMAWLIGLSFAPAICVGSPGSTGGASSKNINASTSAVAGLGLDKYKKPFSIKLLTMSYKFEESIGIYITGNLNGLSTEYFLPIQIENNHVKLYAEYLAGNPTYHGTLYDINTGEKLQQSEITKNSIYTISSSWVNRTPIDGGHAFDFALGLGYRYLNDDGESSASYEREQTYTYLPIQIGFVSPLSQRTTFLGNVEYDHLLLGINKSHLSEVDSSYPDFAFKQKRGKGLKISSGLDFKLDENYSLVAELFYRRWSVADSESKDFYNSESGTSGYFFEPKNTTTIYGLAIGANF